MNFLKNCYRNLSLPGIYAQTLTMLFAFSSLFTHAQSLGDYRTAVSSVTWNSPSDWQIRTLVSGTVTWITASSYPGQNDNVYIQRGHTAVFSGNESCKDLNLDASSATGTKIALGTYSLSVYGKLRAFTQSSASTGTSDGNIPGTSTSSVNSSSSWITSSTGKIIIAGTTRTLTYSGEWGSGNAGVSSPNGFDLEINLVSSADVITANSSLKSRNITISSGALLLNSSSLGIFADQGSISGGNIVIDTRGKLTASSSSSSKPVFARTSSGSIGGTLTLNGELELSGASPYIGMTTIVNNGTVIYSRGGNQNFIEANSGGAPINAYKDIVLSNSGNKTVLIPTSVSGTIRINGSSSLITNAYLTLLSSASGSGRIDEVTSTSLNPIIGSVKVERYISPSGRRWRFLSSPCKNRSLADWQNEIHITGTGGAVNGFDETATNQASVFTYYEPLIIGNLDSGWVASSNISDTILTGKGYRVFIRGPRSDGNGLLDGTIKTQHEVTIDVTGELNVGEVIIPVSYSSSGDTSNDGWNLIGNPYPSAIDWNIIHDGGRTGSSPDFSGNNYAHLSPVIYLFDAISNSYKSYNALSNSGSLTDGIIPSGSGFFIKASSANPTLTFRESIKTSDSSIQLHKKHKSDELGIKFYSDSSESDEFLCKNLGTASPGHDQYDIAKLPNPSLSLTSYGKDQIDLALDCQNFEAESKEIYLHVEAKKQGTYHFDFMNLESFIPSVTIFLKDCFANQVVNIRENKHYSFMINSSSYSVGKGRFKLVFNANPEDIRSRDSEIILNLYPNPATDQLNIDIENVDPAAFAIQVVNAWGEIVPLTMKRSLKSGSFVADIKDLKEGMYFVLLYKNDQLIKTTRFIK